MSKKQKHDRKFCALQKFLKVKALKTFENLYLVNINSAFLLFLLLFAFLQKPTKEWSKKRDKKALDTGEKHETVEWEKKKTKKQY